MNYEFSGSLYDFHQYSLKNLYGCNQVYDEHSGRNISTRCEPA